MAEENEEYLEAAKSGNLVEVADALGDMMYILCGTILSHGMQHKIEEVFEEIQRSNMSKLGEDGQPIYREDGKVLKGQSPQQQMGHTIALRCFNNGSKVAPPQPIRRHQHRIGEIV